MANQYPSNRSRDDYYDRPRSSSGSRPSGGRSGAVRASSARPSATRATSTRPGGTRVPQNGPGGRRAPQRRRKKANSRFYVFLALLVAVILLAVFVLPKLLGCGKDQASQSTGSATSAASTGFQESPAGADLSADVPVHAEQVELSSLSNDELAQRLQSEELEIGSLSAEDMATVEDLSVNQSLPSEWVNILLMGTDERQLNDSARTDSMMICSLNTQTGEIKITSILRDLAVDFKDIGRYNGTYRINAANFFGGPKLAMKTVNECFGMNITRYATVNFYGFQRVAERLGGIELDITEAEMNEINTWAYDTYKTAKKYNVDISDVNYEVLETYGNNVHLNGTQALAYARIRKLDGGGDITRAERQRKVLNKLLDKAKGLDPVTMITLVDELIGTVNTNMSLDDIVNLAGVVMGAGTGDFKTLRLPVNGTYKSERRNDKDMLWDCDFAQNARELYNFIYVN